MLNSLDAFLFSFVIDGVMKPKISKGIRKKMICPSTCFIGRITLIAVSSANIPISIPIMTDKSSLNVVFDMILRIIVFMYK